MSKRRKPAPIQTHSRTPTGGNLEQPRPLRVFIIAGEHSGDALGAKLMNALNTNTQTPILYQGVGGENMEREGLSSQFPIHEVAVMGPLQILKSLPRIARRIFQTIDAAVEFAPDVVVIIDSPEFTHPIAKRIRKRAPTIPIIDYVSPSIWAWRPGRARKMKPYVDHVLALLPFEPEAHLKHGGPPCTYVGHPLAQREEWMRNLDTQGFTEAMGLKRDDDILTVLPGSRGSEVKMLMEPFGEALAILKQRGNQFHVVVPVVKNLAPLIKKLAQDWPVTPTFVDGEDDKFRAFKVSTAALAASGTVTLELAISGTPAVITYKVDRYSAYLRYLIDVPSIVLANLVLKENAYPEYVQELCRPEILADAVELLLKDTPERTAQLRALQKVPAAMAYKGASPSDHAAEIVMRYALERHPQ